MKGNWKYMKLGEVISLEYGKPLEKRKRADDGKYPAYGANGEKCRTNEYLVDKPSIIVGRKGSAGEITLVKDKFWPLDVTYFVTFDETKYDLQFLYYLLLSLNLPKLATGVKPGINRNKVYSIVVNIPELQEQERIVAILDEAFADIKKAQELTEQNLKNARDLFESYLQQAFLPEKHWETNKLSSVCQIKPPKKEAREVLSDTDKVSFVPMDCLGISQKELQLKHERTLSEVAGSYTYFGEDDVLLAKITPCFENGKLGIARGLTNRIGFGSSEFIVFRCGDRMAPDYLYYYLSRQRFIEEGQPLMTGAVGHKRVSKDFIENYSISYPPLSEQKQICGRLDRARAEIDRIVAIYETKLDYLSELRNSLLANTFSGKFKKA